MKLNTEPNMPAPDDWYQALIHAHRGLNDAQSQAFNAGLILLLANHIGDHGVLMQALSAARQALLADEAPATRPG